MWQNVCSLLPRRLVQYLAGISAAMSFFVVGTVTAWPSPALPRLEAYDSSIPITRDEESWVVSMLGIGGVLSSIPLAYVINIFGRKTVLMAAMFPMLVGWLLITFANSVTMLLVSRLMSGLGTSFVFLACPMYIGEIAEEKIRGFLGSLMQLFMNLGMLFVYAVGPYVSFTKLAVLSSIFPILFLFMMTFMQETPYFLLMKGHSQKAETSLASLRGKSKEYVQAELDIIQRSVEEHMQKKATLRDLVVERGSRRALGITIGLIFIQQFGGVNAVLSYTQQIFALTPGAHLSPSEETIIVGAIQLFSGIFTCFLVDSVGRRPLLFMSTFGCSVSLAIMGAYQYLHLKTNINTASYDWLPLVCLVAYLTFYGLGIGGLTLLIMGEIFPTNVKGLAGSIGSLFIGIGFLTVTKLYQVVTDNLGSYTIFWMFSAVSASGMFFVLLFVPETKGKSLGFIVSELK